MKTLTAQEPSACREGLCSMAFGLPQTNRTS